MLEAALLVGKYPGSLGSSGMVIRNSSSFFLISSGDVSLGRFLIFLGRELNILEALLLKLLWYSVAAAVGFEDLTGGVIMIFPRRCEYLCDIPGLGTRPWIILKR